MTEHKPRWRRVLAVLFVALFAILLPITVITSWAHYTVLNEKGWVDTVGPIATDPDVTAALSRQITNELYAALNPREAIAEALPPKASFLAAPIATGVRGFIQDRVERVLNNPKFQELWITANRNAHAWLVAVLRGDTKVLETTNDQVVLNLVPLLSSVLTNIEDFASNVVGKPVNLPTIKQDEVPAETCEKIARALNRPVRPNCGQIVLFPADNLTSAERAVRAFDRGTVALLIITPVLAVAALLLSLRRRRTLLQLSIAGILGLVVMRRLTFFLESELIAGARPGNEAARTAIVDHALNGLFSITQWLLVGLLVIVVIAILAGPYRWAVALRSWVRRTGSAIGHLFSGGAGGRNGRQSEDPTVSWIGDHIDVLRAGGVVVAALVVLLVGLPFWGFVVVAAVLALFELWLFRLDRGRTASA